MHLVEEMSNMTNMVGDGFLLQIGQCWAWLRYIHQTWGFVLDTLYSWTCMFTPASYRRLEGHGWAVRACARGSCSAHVLAGSSAASRLTAWRSCVNECM